MRKLVLVAILLTFAATVQAATPASGAISDSNLTLHFSSGPHFVSNVSPIPVAQTTYVCGTTNPCDEYRIDYALSAGYTIAHPNYLFTISVGWPTHANDFDVYVLDENGAEVGHSASSSDPEAAVVPLTKDSGRLIVRIVPFAVTGDTASGVVTLGPPPESTPRQDPNAPRFHVFAAPGGLGVDSGEPSIGVNPKTNQAMFQAGLQTLRTTFDDKYSPARSNWAAVESQITSTFSLDPISWTDSETGRTVVSQLVSGLGRGIGCSLSAFTDDDGANWTPSEGCGLPAGADHQTVGGGHFAKIQGQALPAPTYQNAVYYCAQAGVTAMCSLSLDGGLTFGPGVPMYDLTVCGGLHGHVQVSPFDGTVYVPNGGCGTTQAVIVSENNGLSWTVRPVPQSLPNSTGFSDPGVAVGAGGTVYFGYRNGDGHAHITISRDKGQTWERDQDVGALAGLQNIQFPTVVAGDDDRAAFAFLGTTEPGNYEAPDFKGVWHLYVAMTFDGGQTWSLTDATGDDPVQRGCIWMEGGSNVCRNMLDFMGAAKDKEGRVLVGFADGCTGSCATDWPNSYSSLATIARQSGGRRLYKAFDPVEPAKPATLYLSGIRTTRGVELSWEVPDHNGSPITGYRVYRGATPGSEQPISSGVDTTKNGFVDTSVSGATPYYRVSAVNAAGESALSNEVRPDLAPIVIAPNPCETPGVQVATDAAGDQTGSTATNHLDLRSISIAEPPFPDGVPRLVFTIKVASLSPTPQPNGAWKASFIDRSGIERFVQMNTFNPAAVAFGYGHIEVGTGGTSSNVNDGALEPGFSGYSPDGTITLVVRNDKVNVSTNDLLGGVHGVTQLLAGVTAGLLLQTDSTSSDTYRVRGSANCGANNPPLAVLNASPNSGTAPLTVTFDGSASYDNDASDTIAGYTFDYGDGTASQSSAIDNASHTYTAAGTYTATLTVTDSRGKQSAPVATTITVLNPATSSAHLTGGGFLEGGFTRFNFDVRGNLTGSFTFNDDDSHVSFSAASGFDAYSVSGACTTFGGNATTDDGRAIHYSVNACDKATPGNKGDTFSIGVTGGASLSRSGPLAGGNIKKH